MILRRVFGAAAACAAATLTAPVQAEEAEAVQLDPIQVLSPRMPRNLIETPAAVTTIGREDAQQGRQGLQMDEFLNRTPGVFAQNRYNFAQDVRISIRGFGARAPFGIRGIRILVDGIPETLPDGQSQVDMIDLRSVESVEVIRGPASALYGNATGGVIDIRTQSGPEEPYIEGTGEFGSYDYRFLGAKGGGQEGPWTYHISAWDMAIDGYREQSRAEKSLLNAKASYDFDDGSRLTTVLSAVDAPLTEDPGGINRDAVDDDRRQANFNATNLDARQEAEQQRLGAIYEMFPSADEAVTARAFYTRREFNQVLPFPGANNPTFKRDFYGTGLQYEHADIAGQEISLVSGVDVERQKDARERYEVDSSLERIAQTEEQDETAQSVGVFSQIDVPLTPRTTGTIGGRYDHLRMKIDDKFQDPENFSDSQTFREWSGFGGVSYELQPNQRVYANVATAFESPTFTEFANPDPDAGGFNPDLESQEATTYEVGIKGFTDRLRYETAVYRSNISDELVVFEQADDGRNFYRNAGNTRRWGLEMSAEFQATDQVSLYGSYTHQDFKFRSYEVEGESFDGNRAPVTPRNQLFGEVRYRLSEGRFAGIEGLWVDRLYADDANDVEVSSHQVFNARVGTESRMGPWNVQTFVALNNMFGEQYFSNVRQNARFGNHFEPAPERNVFAGVTIRPGS